MTDWHPPVDPTTDEHGFEVHPAFGNIQASRVSQSPPGQILFDSEIRHTHYVMIRIAAAMRKRDLNHDWIHEGKGYIEVAMSEAQWASFVSSTNTSGVPCTIQRTEDNYNVDGLPLKPVLGESMAEVRAAAVDAFAEIQKAMQVYKDTPNSPAAAKRRALEHLNAAIANAPANVDYASKTLSKHVENVVQKARVDIEAMVVQKSQQLGLESGTAGLPTLEIES